MQLLNARLCANCDTVYDELENNVCPTCASPHALNLCTILNRRKA